MLTADSPPAYSRAKATAAAIWVFGGYYVGAKVGFALTFLPNPISVLWPPNSILFAALLLVPANMWWVVIAAALPAHLLAELQVGVPVSMVVSWFVVRGSEKGGAAILLPWQMAVGMLGLTLVMCTGAALVSINKVTRLDPAMVFKG